MWANGKKYSGGVLKHLCALTLLLAAGVMLPLPVLAMDAASSTGNSVDNSINNSINNSVNNSDGNASIALNPNTDNRLEITRPQTLDTGSSPMASAGKVALFLVLVLGLIVLLAWLAQQVRLRGNWGGPAHAGRGPMIRTLATQSVGIKEKIAVVQVGDKQLVLGITARQISLLTELDTPLEPTPAAVPAAAPMGFAELLKKAARV